MLRRNISPICAQRRNLGPICALLQNCPGEQSPGGDFETGNIGHFMHEIFLSKAMEIQRFQQFIHL